MRRTIAASCFSNAPERPRQLQHPIRDNRADLRPNASDHAGKHFDASGTPAQVRRTRGARPLGLACSRAIFVLPRRIISLLKFPPRRYIAAIRVFQARPFYNSVLQLHLTFCHPAGPDTESLHEHFRRRDPSSFVRSTHFLLDQRWISGCIIIIITRLIEVSHVLRRCAIRLGKLGT
jgi:hypothetical protein